MGKASRAKRERRSAATYAASLTNCAGTWLERAPDAAEQVQIVAAQKELSKHRATAEQLSADYDALIRLSLEVFRDERFAPLHWDDWVIEAVLDELGEPPVVEDDDDPAFSDYLRAAVAQLGTGRARRALAEQARRFLPLFVAEGKIREALAIEHSAYMTVMSDAATPLLVQMTVGGLARWYDEHEPEEGREAEG